MAKWEGGILTAAGRILQAKVEAGALLKLTKIYPIAHELVDIAMKYRGVIFFEESMGSGSISEKFGNMLAERSYNGSYSTVTADDFMKQASVKSCLSKLGLSCEKITEYVRKRSFTDVKA